MADPITLGLVISTSASLASSLLGPKQPDVNSTGPRVGDTGVTSSAYGETIAVNYGTVRVGGNVIWCGKDPRTGKRGLREVKRTTSSEQGKGGGPTISSTTFAYYLDVAVSIGAGVCEKVVRIWANSKLIYDAREGSETFFKYKTAKIRFYPGDEEQLPDPTMEASEGIGNVSAHRGQAYFVIEDLPVRDFGNGMPQFSVEAAFSSESTAPFDELWENAGGTPADFQGHNPTWSNDSELALDPRNKILWASRRAQFSNLAGATTWSKVDLKLGRIVAQRHMIDGDDDVDAFLTTGASGARQAVVVGPWLLFSAFPDQPTDLRYYRADKNTLRIVASTANVGNLRSWGNVVHCKAIDLLTLEVTDVVYGCTVSAGSLFTLPVDFIDGAPVSFLTPVAAGLPGGAFHHVTPPDRRGFAWASYSTGTPSTTFGLARLKLFVEGSVSEGAGPDGAGVGIPYQFPLLGEHFPLGGLLYDNPSATGYVEALYLDVERQHLIAMVVGGNVDDRVVRFDVATESIVESASLLDLGVPESAGQLIAGTGWKVAQLQQPDGLYFYEGADAVYKLTWDNAAGAAGTSFLIESRDMNAEFGLSLSSALIAVHVADMNALLMKQASGDVVTLLKLDRVEAAAADLADVVLDLAESVGLEASDVDASDLVGVEVQGFEFTRRGSARDAIDRLSIAYLFDVVETDNVVRFKRRGGASVATIDGDDDLGAASERLPDAPQRLKETTLEENSLPAALDLKYVDPARDYQAGSEPARRIRNPDPTVSTDEAQKIELPAVLTSEEAARLVDAHLGIAWTEREQQAGTWPLRWVELDPADVVTFERAGEDDLVVRLEETSFGTGLLTEFASVAEDSSVYESLREGDSGQAAPNATGEDIGTASLVAIDSPLVLDSHSQGALGGPYYGLMLDGGSFRGATIHSSLDAISWTQVDALAEPLLGGFVATPAPALPEHYAYQLDVDTSLRLIPFNEASAEALESITDEQLLSNRNAAWWGNPTTGWEVVKFRDAVDNGDGTWQLGGAMVRARRGTARIAALGHAAGDFFILLNPGGLAADGVGRQGYDASTIGQVRYLRATPLSQPFEAVDFSSLAITGTDLKPYEVVHVESERVGGDDVRLSWIRQTRLGGQSEWGDGVSTTPLGEESEAYQVVLLGGPGHATPGSEALVKSYSAATTAADDFTAAEQAAAGYALSDPLDFVIYQVSAAVGRGFPRTAQVPGT